ncbi:Uncharacterized protein Adt_22619 [Abeliophyllum distichum]|uniref:Gag-pol polyprotein n=1 Tax=Abeliophyllum distichum TaxID=126358 RepID=A0ABD1SA37_9LAMI
MGAAKCLMDYQSEPKKERLQVNSQSRGRENISFKPTSNSNRGKSYSHHKEGHQGGYQGNHQSSYQGNHQGSYWNKEKAPVIKLSTAPRKDGCFLCARTPQASSHYEADSKEDEDVVGASSHRCNTISHRVIEKGEINGKPNKATVDTGDTHNYLTSAEVERLGLVLEKVQMDDFKLILRLEFGVSSGYEDSSVVVF